MVAQVLEFLRDRARVQAARVPPSPHPLQPILVKQLTQVLPTVRRGVWEHEGLNGDALNTVSDSTFDEV